jgi:hypothetical protein
VWRNLQGETDKTSLHPLPGGRKALTIYTLACDGIRGDTEGYETALKNSLEQLLLSQRWNPQGGGEGELQLLLCQLWKKTKEKGIFSREVSLLEKDDPWDPEGCKR